MPVETISWKNKKVRLIDQTLLPHRFKYIICDDIRTLWKAIRTLQVRGAPAIGIAGALGVVLAANSSKAKRFGGFFKDLNRSIKFLASSRPTAINLFWALGRMECVAKANNDKPISEIKKILLKEALKIIDEDKASCRRMARYGAKLVKNGDAILTHCNAGGLATADYGTGLGVLFEAKRRGRHFKVYVDETRPMLQGARLTTWELMHDGIDATLICDNTAASLMEKGKVNKIFVGADRVARNGDTANKIGTYSLAVLANHHRIPFYVVAPVSSFDFRIKSGKDIPIEERDAKEVRSVLGRVIAPKNVKVYNPAFDVTPNELITAIITEKGIFRKPYVQSLRKLRKLGYRDENKRYR
ncbi:MAG: S-methyl-5-thioribose-1-phosphate isomerase [Candidatus Omnitrophica bacterium]|nr:S-methyl-5-thioribose-1-phosphate isomerase [Candidatus Omnitrophota bacterium]